MPMLLSELRPDEEGIKTAARPYYDAIRWSELRPDEEGIKTATS